MTPVKHRLAATVLVTLLGCGVLWWGTDGLSAFTAETARRVDILRSARTLPAVVLEDQDGRAFRLQDYQGRLLAVEFIYTHCVSICRSLGMAFKQIHDQVPQQAPGREFALLSISFDPDRDDAASLKAYGKAFGADGSQWRIAGVHSKSDLKPLLAAFGITVIPDGMGGFEHNAAIHLVGRDGKLVAIADLDQPLALAARIAQWP